MVMQMPWCLLNGAHPGYAKFSNLLKHKRILDKTQTNDDVWFKTSVPHQYKFSKF